MNGNFAHIRLWLYPTTTELSETCYYRRWSRNGSIAVSHSAVALLYAVANAKERVTSLHPNGESWRR
jgi:hypothetical protein